MICKNKKPNGDSVPNIVDDKKTLKYSATFLDCLG